MNTKTYPFQDDVSLTLDFDHACFSSLTLKGEEILHGKTSFFAIKLRQKDDSSRWISGNEFHFVSFEDNKATYTHKEADVILTIESKEDRLVFKADIHNKTQDLLEQVELLSMDFLGKLKDEEDGKGEILFPYNEGVLVSDMKLRMNSPFPYLEPEYPSRGKYSIFPNMLCSQFMVYLFGDYFVYFGMEDEERTTKHLDFKYDGDALKIQLRTFANVDYGEDAHIDFDSVIAIHKGDAYDAMDLYRNWFETHLPKGLVKLKDDTTLPEWYSESPIVCTYCVRGTHDTGDMTPNGNYPYLNEIPFLKKIQEATDSKIMAVLMQWEGTAPWCPPYVYPPYGGKDGFEEFLKEAHQNDIYVGLYCSGLGYTLKSNTVEYSKEKEFEEEHLSSIMCSNSKGEEKSLICKPQRDGLDMCPACEKTKQIVDDELNKTLTLGIDYLQALDQNHGGCSYFCYSSSHGHIPAPGKWQQEEVNALLEGIHHPNALIGCESGTAEPFLKELKFSDNRYPLNYYIGHPFPLYAYLYHEYVNNFMGNQVCMMLKDNPYNYSYRVAYSFKAGDMLTAVLDDKGNISLAWGNDCFTQLTDKNSALTILKNLNAWRRGIGKDYLHLGRMERPLKIASEKKPFMTEYGIYYYDDAVLTSAYSYSGTTMQFLINYDLKPIKVTLPEEKKVYLDPFKQETKMLKEVEIPPLSAVMFVK